MSAQHQDITAPMSSPPVKAAFTRWQLWNMNVGFLGIQFSWGLQMANVSAIFEHLGANAHQLPILWIAAPMTGLLIQPVIGTLSDNTWGFLGRRRPYMLGGAVLAAIALILLPHSSSIGMAFGLLWLLNGGANVSIVPFRAIVGDLLPMAQRIQGFTMQSIMLGIGAVAASVFPWALSHGFLISNTVTLQQHIPLSVELSFYVGAVTYLGAVVWTVLTTPEYPPEDSASAVHSGLSSSVQGTWEVLRNMPKVMQQLAWVQFFTWVGLFCFFLYFPPAVARNVFGATSQDSALYSTGIEWAGLCCALFNGVCVGVSFLLPALARRTSRQIAHSVCLVCGGVSLLAMVAIHNPYLLLLTMIGFGMTWASVLSLPYAMLTGAVPDQQRGIYQGVFNIFVVVPQILVALGCGWVMEHLLHEDRLLAVVLGGAFLLVAAVLTLFVESKSDLVDAISTSSQASQL
ncbi:MAG: MFS transporter [Thermosynechococcaceae cyanobacterium]